MIEIFKKDESVTRSVTRFFEKKRFKKTICVRILQVLQVSNEYFIQN
jgi:hypothetical protein